MRVALVIDDLATFRRAVGRLLRRMGFVVVEAVDGEAGLAELAVRPDVDLVMVDGRLPGMTGFEAIAHLRRDPRFQHTKVLMASALDDEVAADLAIVAGADGFLGKPFTEAALAAQIDHVGLARVA